MKQSIKFLFFIFISISSLFAQTKKRVACIGDSVTKGYNLANGKSYPAQLQELLGEGFLVGNFGKNGATLLEKGHNPYLKSEELKDALEFSPDIVVISLGLNDTDPRNWPNYKLDFTKDYNKLVSLFKQDNPNIEIYVCQMTPIFSGHARFLSGTRDWYNQIQKNIEDIAILNNYRLIDNKTPLASRIDLFDDYLHPNEHGAKLLAENVWKHIVPVRQKLSVSNTIGSNMVLQRDEKVSIYGKASSKEKVILELENKTYSTQADELGNWEVDINPHSAGGPYLIKIKTDQDSILLKNILFGDVYLASGQSNMAFPLKLVKNSEPLIGNASLNNQIRIFKNKNLVETNNSEWSTDVLKRVNDLEFFTGSWETLNAENSSNFSAIAYSFALDIHQDTKVPVGIIELAVGGSNTESWISRECLESNDLLAGYIHTWRKSDFIQDFCKERAGVNLKQSNIKHQRHPYDPSYNFEAGLVKWKNTNIKAVLWYQGESNAHNVELHEQLFKTLVHSWRKNFAESGNVKDKLPFYVVQLSGIDRPSWPYFRDSQRLICSEIANVFMAVSSDLGDSLDVHPKDKIPIGIRLSNLVKKHEFGKNINSDTPQPIRAYPRKNNLFVIEFNNAKNIKVIDGKEAKGFQGMENNGDLEELHVKEIKGNKVILYNPKSLTKIYYGYQPFTRANLVNEESVPVSTFSIKN
ncbi:GDSL-type esterase/lipase family protein [Sphingobacterium sp. 1.A.5]|jgi:sialate O-acetylesterase|uniref:GDSL-type esterase/lipase family protein n=1 Tax=Sphingobacterium sp. 1.A.5 TaxID=2044604 RepID=UPI000C0C100A|nr:GDSL-type esterase/lipase family protein [Sphingobacterium sp. 1.A.5]